MDFNFFCVFTGLTTLPARASMTSAFATQLTTGTMANSSAASRKKVQVKLSTRKQSNLQSSFHPDLQKSLLWNRQQQKGALWTWHVAAQEVVRIRWLGGTVMACHIHWIASSSLAVARIIQRVPFWAWRHKEMMMAPSTDALFGIGRWAKEKSWKVRWL